MNKKGKNFSMNNQGQRKQSDMYETPYSMTEQLLETIEFDFSKEVYEPACGNNAIVKILSKHFKSVYYNDLKYGEDFLKSFEKFPYIITNPPYSIANKFILKCKEAVKIKFALLLPLSYLHGQFRYENIYQDRDFPLSSVNVFTRYPLLGEPLRDDGKYHTGMQVYSWYVWNKKHIGPTVVNWIDNDKYVLRGKK